MLPSRSAALSLEMPVTVDRKGCSLSTAKTSFVAPLLSPQSCTVTARPKPSQKHGSAKHVLFCMTNGSVAIPSAGPAVDGKSLRRSSQSAVPLPKTIKMARRTSGPPPPGMVVPGPFLFMKKLRSGSYGDAIAVRELTPEWWQGVSPGRVLCMKVFNKATSRLRGLLPGIVQEVLAYRHIARAHEHTESEGAAFVMTLEASLQDASRLFLVMELMDCDLQSVLYGYRFPRRENASRWISQIALGISAIHASGVIHRDIKPENLLLDVDGNIRISDFSSAHMEADGPPFEVTGTYAYMAPEMLVNRRKFASQIQTHGPAVDYWSLGCVAFELVVEDREILFDSEEELRRYRRWDQTNQSTSSYLSFAGLSEDAESLVAGLLNLDPLKRYRTDDLCRHPFFANDDGTSEFDHIVARSRQRRHQSYTYSGLNSGAEPELVHGHRNVMTVSLEPPEDDDSFEHFGWVNPRGVWGYGQ
ncbi:kinase-like domain-containing protein [Mycena galericulata]|nr:kinase-like domain-containing protein [Mycena galericulata]